MANVHLLHDNYADAAAYSGGDWVPTLPLANLKTPLVSEAARSVGLSEEATFFQVDLGRNRPISQIALIGHNLSANAVVFVNASDLPLTFYYSATVPVRQPNVVWGSMPWGEFPWDGFLPERANPVGTSVLLHEMPTSIFARYVSIQVLDPGNPAGFVQIGRFMLGEPWVPRINMAYGAAGGIVDPSTATASRGGQKFWDKRAKLRKFTCSFPFASEAEAWGAAYDMRARLGLSGNLLVSYDPAEASALRQRRTLYGSLAQLDDLVTASPSVDYPYSWNLVVEEII